MKRFFTAVMVISVLFLLVGCSSSNDHAQDKSTQANSVGIQTVNLKSDIPGGVTFTVNKKVTASLNYQDNGKDQVLTLVDGGGLTWRLNIPANAIMGNKKIKMTALNNVKNKTIGDLSGGVLLEPNGLYFIVPATLSVSGRNLEKNGVILTGDHNGKQLNYAINTSNGKTIETQLFHFSGAYAGELDDAFNKGTRKAAMDAYETIVDEAKALLKKPIEVTEPPSISLKCKKDEENEEDSAAVQEFIKASLEPEATLINRLLAQRKAYAQASGSDKMPSSNEWEIALGERMVKKGQLMIEQNKPKEDKFLAVTSFALAAEKNLNLLAVGSGTKLTTLLPSLATWAETVARKFVKEINNNHDYTYLGPAMKMFRYAAVLGANGQGYVDELEKSMRFRVEYENHVNAGSAKHFDIITKGEAKINLLTGKDTASGTGKYTSYIYRGIVKEFKSTLDMPNEYPVSAFLFNFEPCKSDTFDILIDNLGADSEKFVGTVSSEDFTFTKSKVAKGYVKAIVSRLFKDKKASASDAALLGGDFYKFSMQLKNKSKTAAEQTFEASDDRFSTKCTIKLIHDPGE
ncbi:MAG: hypothetical protein ACYC56_06465 [Candidatus Aquicultor sp.]